MSDIQVGKKYWFVTLSQVVKLVEIDDAEYFQYLVEDNNGKCYWMCADNLTDLED